MKILTRRAWRSSRAVAGLGATAVAAAAVLATPGVAAANAHVQDLSPACEGLSDAVGFRDISSLGPTTQDAINCAYNYLITNGKVDGEIYAPFDAVKRYEMALFISRSIDYIEFAGDIDVVDAGDAPASGFKDLRGLTPEARAAVDRLAELDIVNGTSATTYNPYAPVNRRDMARFINRLQTHVLASAFAGAEYDPSRRTATFSDVPDAMAGSKDIYAVQSAGIVQGHTSGRYEPFQAVRRDHMALYIMRHLADNIDAGHLLSLVHDEAADGFTGKVVVEFVLKEDTFFASLDRWFSYDSNDTFAVAGTPVPMADFVSALSSGDTVTVTGYHRDPGSSSAFSLGDENPAAPAITAVTGTAPGTEHDVTVTVTPPDFYWNTVVVERAASDGGFRKVATLTWEHADEETGAVTYDDLDRAPGTYSYRATIENDGDLGPSSEVVVVTVPALP